MNRDILAEIKECELCHHRLAVFDLSLLWVSESIPGHRFGRYALVCPACEDAAHAKFAERCQGILDGSVVNPAELWKPCIK